MEAHGCVFQAIPGNSPSPKDHSCDKQVGPFATSVSDHPGRAVRGRLEDFLLGALTCSTTFGEKFGKGSGQQANYTNDDDDDGDHQKIPQQLLQFQLPHTAGWMYLDIPDAEAALITAQMFTTHISGPSQGPELLRAV